MPAISTQRAVSIAQTVTADYATPGNTGTASGSLTQNAPYLILASGQARNLGAGIGESLNLLVGGTVRARMGAQMPFGSPSFDGVDAPQCACASLYTPSGASETLQWQAGDDALDGRTGSCVAVALNLSGIPNNDGRYHQEGTNSDTIVTTPTSGFTTLDSAFTFTPTRSGSHVFFISFEAVANAGTAVDTDRISVRVQRDGSTLDGSTFNQSLGWTGTRYLTTMGVVWFSRRITLTAGVSTTITVQADGTASNGNVGYRRVRIHALETNLIEDDDFQVATNTAGHTEASGGASNISGTSITMNPPASRDYLILGEAQGQFSAWPRLFMRVGASTDLPTSGFVNAAVNTGTGATDDMTLSCGVERVSSVSSSTTVQLRAEAGAGSTTLYGDACSRSDGADINMLAMRLATRDFVDGSIAATSTFEATFIGVSQWDATCTASTALEATFVGITAWDANCSASTTLSATFTGTAGVTASLPVSIALAATFTGTGQWQSSCDVVSTFSATFTGTGSVAGTCTADSAFEATFTGNASVSASLAVTSTFEATFTNGSTGTDEQFTSSLSATTTFAATFTGIGAFAGALNASSSFRWSAPTPISGKTFMRVRTNTRTMEIQSTVREMRIRRDD